MFPTLSCCRFLCLTLARFAPCSSIQLLYVSVQNRLGVYFFIYFFYVEQSKEQFCSEHFVEWPPSAPAVLLWPDWDTDLPTDRHSQCVCMMFRKGLRTKTVHINMLMRTHCYPGHGNSRCCIVANWTCLSILKTFHLSSEGLGCWLVSWFSPLAVTC